MNDYKKLKNLEILAKFEIRKIGNSLGVTFNKKFIISTSMENHDFLLAYLDRNKISEKDVGLYFKFQKRPKNELCGFTIGELI